MHARRVFTPEGARTVPSLQAQALAVLRTAYPHHWNAGVRSCLGWDTAEVHRRLRQLHRCAEGPHWTTLPLCGRPRRRCMGSLHYLAKHSAEPAYWLDGVQSHMTCPTHWHQLYDRWPIYVITDSAPYQLHARLRDVWVHEYDDGDEYFIRDAAVAFVPRAFNPDRAAAGRKRARSPSRSEERARAPQT